MDEEILFADAQSEEILFADAQSEEILFADAQSVEFRCVLNAAVQQCQKICLCQHPLTIN